MNLAVTDFNGGLWTCGNNEFGQLGLGDFENRTFFEKVEIPKDIQFQKISIGMGFMVVLDYDGYIWVCGNNESGQLSKGFVNSLNEEVEENTILYKINDDTQFVDVTAGGGHFFAIDIDGHLWSCGQNTLGQLGVGNKGIDNIPILTRLSNDTRFLSISCGNDHTLAIDENNNLWGCGSNYYGQLGIKSDESESYSMIPINLNFPVNFVNCGFDHSFLIDDKGNLWASGSNIFGELSLVNADHVNKFTKVESETFFKSVYCGTGYTMALDINGNIWSAGLNNGGQLGLGDYKNRKFFIKINNINNINIQSLSVISPYSLILDENFDLWVCGIDEWGTPIIKPNGDNINANYFVKTLNDVALLPDQILQKKYIKSAHS